VRARATLFGALLLSSAAAAFGAAFPAVLRLPPRSPATVRAVPAALFSHRAHQSFGCFACHPSLFPQAPLGFTHEDMRQDRFCGHCHQGAIAFAIEGASCARCHAQR
jgi:c(7)-type cytochrome triheme protein